MREFHALDMRQPPRQKRRPQLDHAFLPTQTSVTTATLTAGYVTDRNGTRRSIAADDPAIIGWDGGVIDFTTLRRWYVQIRYIDTAGSTQGDFSAMEWIGTALGFPAHRTNSGWTVNIPVIEFTGTTWSSMIRRQTNDIIDSPHNYDDLNDAPSTGEPWPEPPPYNTIPDAPDPTEPWPTDPVPAPEPECDQNDHPGDGYTEDDPPHPGEGDEDDDKVHPGIPDCYSSN